jgi:protein-L-isoaspartate(D-aspartate) O-methyltransferase
MFEHQREAMVRLQIAGRGINSPRLLEAFTSIERHKFIPEELWHQAYGDWPLPIGNGQTISQPYMVALMTDLLRLDGTESVLEIGTGSGYQTAILCSLSKRVYSIERDADLSQTASKNLRNMGINNFVLIVGDGTLGWNRYAPFDRIIVTAGAPSVPPSLLSQLKDDGRMVIPVGNKDSQEILIIDKSAEGTREEMTCPCRFVPLVGKEGWTE